MSSFAQRSGEKELLDRDDIPFEDIRLNMQELDFINRRLGGHRITVDGLRAFTINQKKDWKVAEIGCGGGDNLRVLKDWAKKEKKNITLTGVDINPHCIQYAESLEDNNGIGFICSDYKKLVFQKKPDVIFSSLFCHHFTNEELVYMLSWMHTNSRIGFFINDLHRHSLAYHSIGILTKLFSKSYLVKNDAPLSVKRGFTRKDWERLFSQAGLNNFTCEWKWAFRWLITYRH
jgi:2-polyprenyl-3-methyl-5-hydroxy-6-metoxy-1,4-benzoquinol methylase